MNTTRRGDISTAKILARFIELGYSVLVPRGSARYDLALDMGDRFVRVECRTGRLRNGCVVFNTASNLYGGRGVGYTGAADLFAVYCRDTDGYCTVPVERAATAHMALRIADAGKPHPSINWARTYELRQSNDQGPVVKPGPTHHTVNVKIAGSNPVGTASAEPESLPRMALRFSYVRALPESRRGAPDATSPVQTSRSGLLHRPLWGHLPGGVPPGPPLPSTQLA